MKPCGSKLLGWRIKDVSRIEPSDRAIRLRLVMADILHGVAVYVPAEPHNDNERAYAAAVEAAERRGWLRRCDDSGRCYEGTVTGYRIACRVIRESVMSDRVIDARFVAQALAQLDGPAIELMEMIAGQRGNRLNLRNLPVYRRESLRKAEALLIREGLVRRRQFYTVLRLTPAGRWLIQIMRRAEAM